MDKIKIFQDIRNRLKAFITERSGIYFRDHDLKGLDKSIELRMASRGFDSPISYYNYLVTSDKKEDEFRELLNILTINHTYFFRNEPHFQALREKVFPELISKKRKGNEKPSIRIWSAGCSTGEEPYSLAMLISELIPDYDEWDIEILATDASEKALKKAKEALYSGNSLRFVSREMLEKYFIKKSNNPRKSEYTLSEQIKNMVTFNFFNLMDEDYPFGFDIIFCRNVVIYFEFDTTVKVMSKIYSSLSEEGYLFIGYSESLRFLADKFEMITAKDAVFYRKKSLTSMVHEEPVGSAKEEAVDLEKILDDMSREQALADLNEELQKQKKHPETFKELIAKAIKSIRLKEYDKALLLVDEAVRINKFSTEPYYLAAEAFVNQGKFEDAKMKLNKALKINSMFAPAYYLLGCIYIQQEETDMAKDNLNKALYIEGDFLLAHFYLGLVYKTEGRFNDAIREYRNTLKLLSNKSSQDILAYSGGFNTSTIRNVCRDNLERLKAET